MKTKPKFTKPKFRVTTYFTYSVSVDVEAKNETDAWLKGRKQALNTPIQNMDFVDTENTIVMDEKLNVLID